MSARGPRSPSLRRLARLFRIAHHAERTGMSSAEAVERARDAEATLLSRRAILGGAAAASALAVTAGSRRAFAGKKTSTADIAVVGAGLAGLQAAHDLAAAGLTPTVYDANTRVGGRQFSLRGLFPGQTAENGGELIDTPHKTMQAWINTLNLTREDITRGAGEIFYYFGGTRVPEEDVVEEYRVLVEAMHDDLRASSGAPTADAYNTADRELDLTTLTDYLISRGAGPIARAAIEEAYVAEYGRECTEQSCLNFLLFIHADRRSKFTPFGVFSDERFHVVEGNDSIATGIAATLPRAVELGMRLEAVRKTSAGRIELTFRQGNHSVTRTHDRAVLAIPFTVLRTVSLDASLGLPAWKTKAINELGYGDNAKMMVGFNGPFWLDLGCTGAAYSDLTNCQTTWETSPTTATTAHAVLTDYSGGVRGKNLDAAHPQAEAARFLADLETVMPGAQAAATRVGSNYRVHLEHWPSNPLTKGSYTCYLPGQFTEIAGNEAKSVGNLHFCGEHANSFYDWQGFMEGALLSGIDVAAEVLAAL
jgi:monoamine oxidase